MNICENGVIRTMNEQEREEQMAAEREAFYAEINAELDDDRKMKLFIQSIPVLEKPQSQGRSSENCLWKPVYDREENCFRWEEEQSEG